MNSPGCASTTGAAPSDLLRRFRRGDFDLVSVGRSLIGDPDWVAKMSEGDRQGNEYLA